MCRRCNSQLKVQHVYQAGPQARAQDMACSSCRTRFTSVTIIVGEVKERGQGAAAVASALREKSAKGEPLEVPKPQK